MKYYKKKKKRRGKGQVKRFKKPAPKPMPKPRVHGEPEDPLYGPDARARYHELRLTSSSHEYPHVKGLL